MYFYYGKNTCSFSHTFAGVKVCVAAIGAMYFSVRSLGCALFYLLEERNVKRICSFLTVLAMVVTILVPFPITATAETATSGTTGDCTWTLDGTVLTISGNGAMADYAYNSTLPWGTKFTELIISEGVTHIGDYAFYGSGSLTIITIPSTVTSIGSAAFRDGSEFGYTTTSVYITDLVAWCNIVNTKRIGSRACKINVTPRN